MTAEFVQGIIVGASLFAIPMLIKALSILIKTNRE